MILNTHGTRPIRCIENDLNPFMVGEMIELENVSDKTSVHLVNKDPIIVIVHKLHVTRHIITLSLFFWWRYVIHQAKSRVGATLLNLKTSLKLPMKMLETFTPRNNCTLHHWPSNFLAQYTGTRSCFINWLNHRKLRDQVSTWVTFATDWLRAENHVCQLRARLDVQPSV